MSGGWTPYTTEISAESKSVFEKAIKVLLGVTYTPLAVATQVVAGTNFSFFCNAKAVSPNSANEAAMVLVFRPLQGDPHLVSITRIAR